MNYTYLLETESVKQMRNTLDNDDDNPMLIILCYHITDDCKQPFLQFLFRKTPQNPILTEQFTLPYIYLDDSTNIMSQTISYVKSALSSMKCDSDAITEDNFKGIIYLADNFPVALMNISEVSLNYIKVYRNTEYWFLLPSEIINAKSCCNIQVDKTTCELFTKYGPTLTLLQNPETGVNYSLPDVVYTGAESEETKFNSIFGQRPHYISELQDNKKYYSFYIDFIDAVLDGGWVKNGGINKMDESPVYSVSGRQLTDNEYGRYLNNGINRYAIFVNSISFDNSLEEDNIKYITVHNKHMIITKFYENFKPLSYHGLNKDLLGDKYDMHSKHYMII
jgi:hypothetical protein